MKKKALILFLILVTLPGKKALAQNYSNSIGVSLGGVTGISFNTFFQGQEKYARSNRFAITGMLGIKANIRWFGIENMIRAKIAQKKDEKDPDADFLKISDKDFIGYMAMGFFTYNFFLNDYIGFYAGPGISLGLSDFGLLSGDSSRYIMGITGIGGVDFKVFDSNFNVTLAYTPNFNFIDNGKVKVFFINGMMSLGLRYIVN
ncbi:MAG: hypothetical protein ACQPRJ_04250 [Solitalea-like symbiont of Acarus siro]